MKKLLALALALVLTLSFTGCHGTLASEENTAVSVSYPVPDEFPGAMRSPSGQKTTPTWPR